jgi:hypothetical protein
MGLWTAAVHVDAVDGADTCADGEGFPFIRVAPGRALSGASSAQAERNRGGAGTCVTRASGAQPEGEGHRSRAERRSPVVGGRETVPRKR